MPQLRIELLQALQNDDVRTKKNKYRRTATVPGAHVRPGREPKAWQLTRPCQICLICFVLVFLLFQDAGVDAVIEQLDRFGLDKDEFDLLMEWGEKFIRDESMHFQSLVPSGTKMKLTRTFVAHQQWLPLPAGGILDVGCRGTELLDLTHVRVYVFVLFDSLFSFCCFACFFSQLEAGQSPSQGESRREEGRRRRVQGPRRSLQRRAGRRRRGRGHNTDAHAHTQTQRSARERRILLCSDRNPPN
jgi:hypothetical protein